MKLSSSLKPGWPTILNHYPFHTWTGSLKIFV